MQERKKSVAIISENFPLIRTGFGLQLRLVDVMNLLPISSRPFDIQEQNLCNYIKRTTLTLACIQTFTHLFLSNLVR